MSYFQTLLSVAIEHSYNSDGVCPSLKFNPTEKTQAVFSRTGLLCTETSNGIQIIYDHDRLEALEMWALDPLEQGSFDFLVSSSDPDFRGYTEPFTGIEDELLYFDNRMTSGVGRQVISESEHVSGRDLRQSDSTEFEGILGHKDRLILPEFVLKIFADNKKGPLLQQWLEQAPTTYSLRFSSRQRYWKYYLRGKVTNQNNDPEKFFIFDPDRGVEFESMGEETLADQSIAYTFRSKKQIPIFEHYPFRLELRHKDQSGESTVIPRLPVASVKQLGRDAVADQEIIVSEIYINS